MENTTQGIQKYWPRFVGRDLFISSLNQNCVYLHSSMLVGWAPWKFNPELFANFHVLFKIQPKFIRKDLCKFQKTENIIGRQTQQPIRAKCTKTWTGACCPLANPFIWQTLVFYIRTNWNVAKSLYPILHWKFLLKKWCIVDRRNRKWANLASHP